MKRYGTECFSVVEGLDEVARATADRACEREAVS